MALDVVCLRGPEGARATSKSVTRKPAGRIGVIERGQYIAWNPALDRYFWLILSVSPPSLLPPASFADTPFRSPMRIFFCILMTISAMGLKWPLRHKWAFWAAVIRFAQPTVVGYVQPWAAYCRLRLPSAARLLPSQRYRACNTVTEESSISPSLLRHTW